MTDALRRGDARAYVLGLGVDPLTFATDLLTALVLPRPLFSKLFARLTPQNAEGHLVANGSDVHIPFTEEFVRKFAETEPMQAGVPQVEPVPLTASARWATRRCGGGPSRTEVAHTS